MRKETTVMVVLIMFVLFMAGCSSSKPVVRGSGTDAVKTDVPSENEERSALYDDGHPTLSELLPYPVFHHRKLFGFVECGIISFYALNKRVPESLTCIFLLNQDSSASPKKAEVARTTPAIII